ncbi:MAG: hypothetical protein WKF43_11605 [Acidimicrobiales bacterium]
MAAGVVAIVAVTAAPAAAAPPVNDTLDGAIAINSIPFTFSQSTVEAAQNDDFETGLNELCGAPVVEHGVWFTGTAATTGFINVDVTASDYSAGIMAFEGTPSPEGLLACGPGQLGPLPAGPDLKLLVFGDGLTTETSGNLVLQVSEAPPPLELGVTIDPVGKVVPKTGVVTITGTVTCSSPAFVFQDVLVQQRAGRVILSGLGFVDLPCVGTTPWSGSLTADNGIFKAGKAHVDVLAFSPDAGGAVAEASAEVRLRGSSAKNRAVTGPSGASRRQLALSAYGR